MFEKLHKQRKKFLKENAKKDFAVLKGENNTLISAPHAVSQVRLGKNKVAEIGSLVVALFLQKETNSFLIAKTKNNFDDANFDIDCAYKLKILDMIRDLKTKYLFDIHGLGADKGVDINLGTGFEKNTQTNPKLLQKLIKDLKSNGFSVSIDNPFMAGPRTIAGYSKDNAPDIWSIQIEINCAITNKRENEEKLEKLLNTLKNFINSLP